MSYSIVAERDRYLVCRKAVASYLGSSPTHFSVGKEPRHKARKAGE